MMSLRTLVLGKTQIDEGQIFIVDVIAAGGYPRSIVALAQSDSVLHAFLFGCESRQPKLVQISLTAMQKLITHRAVPAVETI